MGKLLVVCGPTATGKTALAISLARSFNGEIVSADSKQIYKGLDIGTGKDVSPDAKRQGYYQFQKVKIWGYDLVNPKSHYSVAEYLRFARIAIRDIGKLGKLPILVGGTGLYIKAVVDGIATARIPRKEALRTNLENKSVDELFEILAQLDAVKAGSLNISDRKNPRRLIRAIEIGTWKLEARGRAVEKTPKIQDKILFIGLTLPREKLLERIKSRVDARIKAGIIREIKALLEKGVDWNDQAMSSLGYRQWKKFFDGEETRAEASQRWKAEESKYAKRQMTWFKKDKRINWFDVSSSGWQKKVEKLAKKWYSS
jgi:tRNA dimethylallyltransferase